MSEHDIDPHAMVGAYVADALDDDERASFEQHLGGCGSCRREVAEFAETTAELSWLTSASPPATVRASVLAEIATVRPLPPEEPAEQAEPPDQTLPGPVTARLDGEPPGESPPADELAARRQRRTPPILTSLVAAALVLVVALGGWVAVLVGDQRQEQATHQQISGLLTAPDAEVYPTRLEGAPISFVVSKERGQALFLARDLPPPGEGKVYQLWMIGEEPAPNATIARGGDVTQWFAAGPLAEARQLAITIEPPGGALTPSLPAVAGVEL